jgi:signal transduction histidine kinase
MTAPLLRVQSLSRQYGSLVVLNDISFQVEQGEIIGVVGRRGAGKSTLLQLLGGSLTPTSGEIFLEGHSVRFINPMQARHKGIELVPQTAQLHENLGVVENIFLGRELCTPPRFGVPNWERMYSRSKELLAGFQLPVQLLSGPTANLSEEQRQMIALARALCVPVRLLLLDDFMATLSFQRQQIVLQRLKTLAKEQGTSVIISSDNLKHLFSITDRIVVLFAGRLSADRRTSDCTARDIVELIVGASNREQVTPIIWALESFHAAQAKTEELFQAQTVLHKNLEASDSLNRQLVQRLSKQVRALDRLNTALQDTQRRLLTEREEERKSLARELHDQIIQDLLSINYSLEEAEDDEISEEHRDELISIRTGIRQVVSDLRQLCRDLRPPTIDNLGLSSAIRSLVQEWAERNDVELELNIDSKLGRLPEAIELSVFRIVQEGINNIGKHAAARRVKVNVQRSPTDTLMVRIEDDGQGLTDIPDLAHLSANNHFGLVGISERAALLGGTMRIYLPEGGGLGLEVEIPTPYPSS